MIVFDFFLPIIPEVLRGIWDIIHKIARNMEGKWACRYLQVVKSFLAIMCVFG